MIYPPGLLIAALLFWAALNRTETAAVLLLLLLPLSRLSRWRWQIDAKQFFRLGDLTSVLVLLALGYVYATQNIDRPIYLILQWLPVLFAPLLFAQLFGGAQSVPLGTLFYSLRKRVPQPVIDFRVPYAGVCVLAAGAANVQTPVYFFGAAALFAWLLLYARPRGRALPLWLLFVAAALASAYFGQLGLRQMQTWVEGQAEEWLSNWAPDPYRSRTAIGDVGALKLSGKIEFRVAAPQPDLLHEASYDRYAGQYWFASQRMFNSVSYDSSAASRGKRMTFFRNFKRQAILALPQGVENIAGLEGVLLSATPFGVVKAEGLPGFVQYRVYYSGIRKSPPGKYDLDVPEQHRDWTRQIVTQLGLAEKSPEAAAAQLRWFFRSQYRYSLYLGVESDADEALRGFVLDRKAGHCEYFAAATVLLLRASGIPARLATGYALREYDPDLQLYIVRRRHAHAWASAFIGGRWQDVDATPAQWAALEAAQTDGIRQSIEDFFSRLAFEFKRWRSAEDNRQQELGLGIAGLLTLYLAFRLYRNRGQWRRTSDKQEETAANPHPGLDSPWYRLEQALHGTDLALRRGESVQQWSRRLQQPELQDIARLHYRYRFDPAGLPVEEQARLRQAVQQWLAERVGH
ncbi:MAG: transglutaminase-like domain-containing protein [Gammaproteobacteria bacterium]